MRDKRNAYRLFVGKPEGKDHYEDQDVGRWIILKWILEREDRVVWTGLVWLRIGTSGGSCECGNKPSGSTKDG
jgi:hypothetical protein